MPTVSVVIPTYNRSDILPRAIGSVLSQTHDDLELLVVDDGSTEDVESVVRRHGDDRVRYVAHETNRGANVARNTGIEEATGDYVAFLDSDDEWRPTKLEAQLDRLATKDDEFVAVYCDYEVTVPGLSGTIQEAAARLLADGHGDPREGGDELVAETLADDLHTGAGSTLLVERDVAESIGGFDPSLDWFQDPDFLIRVIEEGNLAHVPEPLVVRHYSGSPDADTARRADQEFLQKFSEDVERFDGAGYDILGAHNLVLAKYFLQEGRLVEGVHYLKNSTIEPRQVPGVLWYAGRGVRRRKSLVVTVAALAVVAMAVGRTVGSR